MNLAYTCSPLSLRMLHITLSSDFGLHDHAAAIIKGKLYTAFPECTVTDITHNNTPGQITETVYHVQSVYPYFPSNTFHLIYNDLYANASRRLIYTTADEQHIFGADNGIMLQLFKDKATPFYFLDEIPHPYNYIHVTDAFIRQIDCIRRGVDRGLSPANVKDMHIVQLPSPAIGPDFIEARVLRVDAFGNVILDCTRAQFDYARAGRMFKHILLPTAEITEISTHYDDVLEGKALCRFNSAGYLEIAINHGKANSLLGLSAISEKDLFYQKVKIHF